MLAEKFGAQATGKKGGAEFGCMCITCTSKGLLVRLYRNRNSNIYI